MTDTEKGAVMRSTEELTNPQAVDLEYRPHVLFANGESIECYSAEEAVALAAAWRRWPHSPHPPVEEKRAVWRTGFAEGAVWAGERKDGRVE